MSVSTDNPLGVDRRALRTRHLLAQALISLGGEMDVDAIEVGELVEQAGIARSTFYAHFAGKDDFLVRSFVNMIAATEAAYAARYPDRTDLLPSEPLFHHVAGAADFARSIARSDIFPHQMAAGEAKLREIVEGNLVRRMPHWTRERRREAAVFIAGGFIALMRWWMQNGVRQPPAAMQDAFVRLSAGVLADG